MPIHLRDIARMIGVRLHDRQGTRTTGAWLADEVARFAGSWTFVLVHVAWFALWLTLHLDINLLTLIVSLEAIFLATFVLMSQNRASQAAQAQIDRIELIEQHLDKLVSVDHDEHGRLLREIHEHITCEGHTTIGLSNALPPLAPEDAEKTIDDPPTVPPRQNRNVRTLRAMWPDKPKKDEEVHP